MIKEAIVEVVAEFAFEGGAYFGHCIHQEKYDD